MNYILETIRVASFTAIGTKLCGVPNEDVISISAFMATASLIHKIGLDLFKHFYTESRKRLHSGLKTESMMVEDKDEKTGKPIIREATFEEQISTPFLLVSCLISYKITEILFKKISEEFLKKSLMFLSMVVILNSHNVKRIFI